MDGSKRARLASVVVGVMALMLVAPLAAGANAPSDEQQFVDLINHERQAAGAGTLEVVPELTAGARAQAAAMAAAGHIFHNQRLGDLLDGWQLMGENVGMGGDVESLHAAFMSSPGHRDNLLNPAYDAVGVGVVWSGGIPFVSEVFLDWIAPVPDAFVPPFRDDDRSVHEDDIGRLYDLGITRGCGPEIYCPDRPVTRAEMATLVTRAFGLTDSGADRFTDDEASAHESAINALSAAGVTHGCAPGRYCPDRPITRAEMATFLVRALHLPLVEGPVFDDTAATEHAAAISSLAAAGITKGCSATSFCPGDYVTRGQMASFLIRALSH